jgi:hypothetical protein
MNHNPAPINPAPINPAPINPAPIRPLSTEEIRMPTYEVSVLTRGGADARRIRVQATSPDRAKEAAVAIANAQADANRKSYQYHVTHVRQA